MKELRYLNKYFLKYKYRLFLGISISVLSKFLTVQIPNYIGKTLDIAVAYIDKVISYEDLEDGLSSNIMMIIGVALLSGIFTFIMRQTIIVMSRLVEFDLKNEIFKHYEKLSLNFYKMNRTGDLMSRITEDVSKVRMYVGPVIMYTINMLVLFSVTITIMARIDKTLTFYTIAPFPILSISIYTLSRVINKRSTIVQEYIAKLTTYSQENFSGINIIKSYSLEPKTVEEFTNLANDNKDKNMHLVKANALFLPLMILLIGLSNLIVLYIGGQQYIDGKISLGTIAQFIMYVNMLTWPVATVGWVTSMTQEAEASQKRINEFLQKKPNIQNEVERQDSKIEGNITFDNVSFTYEDTNIKALNNISFSLKKGQTLGILGKTGSGKSTILNLLTRLYDIEKGSIKIDGKPIKEVHLKQLREAIGFVPQDSFLFSDTITNNIKFGKESATMEEIHNYAKMVHIHDNIIGFKEGYNTNVGERGVTLSGGQKQRISIARAMIKEPEILILDDTLSAVDTKTEEIILNNIKYYSKNKTTLIVSHRISSIKHADKIIVLEDGKIKEEGNHNSLIKHKGYYTKLYKQQLIE